MQKAICETWNLEADGRQLQKTTESATPVSPGQEVKAIIPLLDNRRNGKWLPGFLADRFFYNFSIVRSDLLG